MCLAVLFSACKPTEKNYRTAYEKASQAAERKAAEEAVATDGHILESLDGPRIHVVDGDTVMIGHEMAKPIEAGRSGETGRMGIAVARYTMQTNARRHAEDISAEYPAAFVAKDGQDNYYVMIKRVPNVDAAIEPVRIFRISHPGYRYIGLGNAPRLIPLTE